MAEQEKPGGGGPPQALFEMLHGLWAARAIQVATTWGIPDLLKDGPKSVEELAQATGAHAPSLYRLLRALASVGVFAEVEPRTFAPTEFSRFLQSDQPGSLYHLARMMNAPWHWRSWGELEYSVRTGKPVFEQIWGMDRWQYFQQNPEEGKLFNLGISNFSHVVDRALVAAYDYSGFQTLVDVAGGYGSLLVAILQAYPHLQGVLFEQPAVVEGARRQMAQAGLDGRYQLVAGDMFVSLPSGADAYLLKEIIHNWDDEHALQILRVCRQAMAPNSRLLVADMVIRPGGKETSFAKLIDLEMLLNFSGRERTAEEFAELYQAAGFKLTRVVPTHSPLAIIEGVAV